MEKFDAIVIGAGFAGMNCAALLAHSGLRTLVIEKDPVIGGRAATYNYRGITMDRGVHANPRGVHGYTARTTIEVGEELPNHLSCRPHITIIEPDGSFKALPQTISDLVNSPLLKTGDDKAEFIRTLDAIKRLSLDEIMSHREASYAEWEKDNIESEAVKKCLEPITFVLTTIEDAKKRSASDALYFLQGIIQAGFENMLTMAETGGSVAILKPLEKAIKKNGAIKLDTELKEIIIKGKAACGILASQAGSEYSAEASAIVYAAPVAQLFRQVDKALFSKDFAQYVDRCIGKHSSTLGFAALLDKEVLPAQFKGYVLGKLKSDPSKYFIFFSPSNISPRGGYAPEGTQLLFYGIFFPPEDGGDREKIKGWFDIAFEEAENIFPDLRDHFIWHKTGVERVAEAVDKSPGLDALSRPGPEIPGIEGLYICGDSVWCDAMATDGAAGSGRRCARAILSKAGINSAQQS